jgi:hypothetical protein
MIITIRVGGTIGHGIVVDNWCFTTIGNRQVRIRREDLMLASSPKLTLSSYFKPPENFLLKLCLLAAKESDRYPLESAGVVPKTLRIEFKDRQVLAKARDGKPFCKSFSFSTFVQCCVQCANVLELNIASQKVLQSAMLEHLETDSPVSVVGKFIVT